MADVNIQRRKLGAAWVLPLIVCTSKGSHTQTFSDGPPSSPNDMPQSTKPPPIEWGSGPHGIVTKVLKSPDVGLPAH